jgi:hypothetical protein
MKIYFEVKLNFLKQRELMWPANAASQCVIKLRSGRGGVLLAVLMACPCIAKFFYI